jgi:hypothetical protein
MRKHFRFIVIVLAAALLSGCASGNSQETPMQSASGGSVNAAAFINLKDVNIASNADQTVVTFSLISGSRNSDIPESKLLGLPEYSVVQLSSPYRIMITLQNIIYWDYIQKGSLMFSDFLLSLFQEAPAVNDSLIIYLQLSGPAEFAVEESEGDLIIRLKPAGAETGSKYYCVSNSFTEHQEGVWPADIHMSPVLCSDRTNKLLISQPFDTMEDAESYRDSINAELQGVLPGKALSVIELAAGTLPDYINIDYSAAENRSVLRKDGAAVSTPLLLQNGRYLTTSPDGRIAFSRSFQHEEPSAAQDVYLNYEKLWMLDANGRMTGVDTADSGMIFYMIDSAKFSYDGRYICIKDVSIQSSVLYVYDFRTTTLRNLGEEYFGDQTADFAWSDKDNTLYAMTGYNGTLQMLYCTFAEDGGITFEAKEEQAGAAGHLGVSQGRLFFADNYAGIIYEVGEARTALTSGMDFRISPDGSTMAVLETRMMDGEQVLTNLKLYDIVTGECLTIADHADIVSFGFSSDGDTVIYTDAAIGSGATDGYPFGLFAYDTVGGKLTMPALCSTGDIAFGASGRIYLIQYFNEAASSFYATYQYDLG